MKFEIKSNLLDMVFYIKDTTGLSINKVLEEAITTMYNQTKTINQHKQEGSQNGSGHGKSNTTK